MKTNILLCGVGGQGTVLASKLISQSAMSKGIPVMSAETIGMAQKGGSVVSYIRLGDGLYTPMIPMSGADLIIAFEPGEAVRMLPYLKPDGWVIANTAPVKPVTAALRKDGYEGPEMVEYLKEKLSNLILVDGSAAAAALGSAKVINMVLLGAALTTGKLPVSTDDIKAALATRLAEKLLPMNYAAIDYIASQEA